MVAGFRQKIRKPLLLILESREVNIKFKGSFAEIECLDSIIQRKNLMLFANQINEKYIWSYNKKTLIIYWHTSFLYVKVGHK